MVPQSITLNGFKCFTATHTFQYPTEPGLYFVTGRNEVEKELEANACGKSTLFCDAICWCLYGKTPRGVKAGDVVNWGVSSAWVDFSFRSRDVHYRVQRYQHPNTLTISINQGPVVNTTQEELERRIGLDYSAFCNSIIFSQLTDTFFDLRPAEKSEVLESVLPLEVWEEASKRAKQRSDVLQKEMSEKSEVIAGLKGQLLALNELDLEDKIAEWEAVRSDEIAGIIESFAEDDAKLLDLRAKGKFWQEKEAETKRCVIEIESLLAEAEAEYEGIYAKILQIERNATAKSTEIGMLQKEIARLRQLGPECSMCKQKIAHEHLETEENKYQKRIDVLTGGLSVAKNSRLEVDQQLKVVGSEVGEIKNARMNFVSGYNDANRHLGEVKIRVSQLLEEKKRKEFRIANLEARTNPFVEQKRKIEDDKRKLKSRIVQVKGQLTGLDTQLTSTQYWIKGFSEVKLMLISDILTQLELEVNNYLYQFGLHHWKVEFSVESTTKTGKARKGFAVTIKCPSLESAVPWSSWSGGETQRLRLAGALGMSDLILACFGLTPGLEVHDEPSQFLSVQGITDLISVLKDRAISTHRQIFLIDHRNLDTGTFNGIYTVVRKEECVEVVSE